MIPVFNNGSERIHTIPHVSEPADDIDGMDVYYLNERYGECDFVVCKGNRVVQAIQVSYDISAEKTRKREIKGLLHAAEQTKCNNLLLLTDHESGVTEESGHQIRIQPVYEWSIEIE